jgi:hypothetical protein
MGLAKKCRKAGAGLLFQSGQRPGFDHPTSLAQQHVGGLL